MKLFGWYRILMRNPKYRWIVILGSLLYLISPIDLSPDIIPFIGQIDDVILISLLFSEFFQRLLGSGSLESPTTNFSSQSNRQSYASTDSNVRTVDVNAELVDTPKSQKRSDYRRNF